LYYLPEKYQFHFVWQTAQRRLFAASIIRLSRSIDPNWEIARDPPTKTFSRGELQ
jgi:hypothetical protein